jgi:hypothetical protein
VGLFDYGPATSLQVGVWFTAFCVCVRGGGGSLGLFGSSDQSNGLASTRAWRNEALSVPPHIKLGPIRRLFTALARSMHSQLCSSVIVTVQH